MNHPVRSKAYDMGYNDGLFTEKDIDPDMKKNKAYMRGFSHGCFDRQNNAEKLVFKVGELVKYSDYDGRYQTTVSIVKILNINPRNNVCLVEKLENGFWNLASMSDLAKLPEGVTV